MHINNVPLVYVDSIKYLGFTFSENDFMLDLVE